MNVSISFGSFSNELIKLARGKDLSAFHESFGGTPVGGATATPGQYPGTPIRMPLRPLQQTGWTPEVPAAGHPLSPPTMAHSPSPSTGFGHMPTTTTGIGNAPTMNINPLRKGLSAGGSAVKSVVGKLARL